MNNDPSHKFSTPNERWYDAELEPALRALAQQCEARGIAFHAVAEYDPGQHGMTSVLPPNAGLGIVMLRNCTSHGTNIDAYVLGLIRYCKERGIDYSGSLVMQVMEQAQAKDDAKLVAAANEAGVEP